MRGNRVAYLSHTGWRKYEYIEPCMMDSPHVDGYVEMCTHLEQPLQPLPSAFLYTRYARTLIMVASQRIANVIVVQPTRLLSVNALHGSSHEFGS